MPKVKKIPQRQCVGCREMKDKKSLLRVVKSPEGVVSLDFVGKKPGRGAYVCHDVECLKKARASIEQALLAAQLNELQDLISIDVKSAVLALDELTGELITDNILDNIFEHFCIGK